MVEQPPEMQSIVVRGKWNVGIFHPAWLNSNVFKTSEDMSIQFPMDVDSPRIVTKEAVTVVVRTSTITFIPANTSDACLKHTEEIACSVLSLLSHTPVTAVGINFLYRSPELPDSVAGSIPAVLEGRFAELGLVPETRTFAWRTKYEDRTMNLKVELTPAAATFQFNFHSEASTPSVARQSIDSQILKYRDASRKLLRDLFDVS